MKLMYCGHCGDIVRLFPETRKCKCGLSWGRYLEDNRTTIQTKDSISLGFANPDFQRAFDVFMENRDVFSPELSIRVWINPDSEPDVIYVVEAGGASKTIRDETTASESNPSETQE